MRTKGIIVMAVFGLGAFATGLACGNLGDALQNEECYSEDDCGPLNCVIPIPPQNIPVTNGDPVNNVTGIGWCREQAACSVGAQPFCVCAVDAASQIVCNSGGDYNRVVPSTQPCFTADPTMTANPGCFCVPLEVQCLYPATP